MVPYHSKGTVTKTSSCSILEMRKAGFRQIFVCPQPQASLADWKMECLNAGLNPSSDIVTISLIIF